MKLLALEQIAMVCHEANRAYCATIGDFTQVPWHEAPDWQKDSARNGVNFHMTTLHAGGTPNPAESHVSWLKQKTDEGWVYGPEKNVQTKQHPCCLPYDQLPFDQKMKDYIFVAICTAFYKGDKESKSQSKEAI